jgi:hypothetical protein
MREGIGDAVLARLFVGAVETTRAGAAESPLRATLQTVGLIMTAPWIAISRSALML